MITRKLFGIALCLGCVSLVGCSVVRDSVVDQAAGFPASHVISDVASTSSEYREERRQERVDELDREYQEFIRSRETGEAPAEQQSIMLNKDEWPEPSQDDDQKEKPER